MIKKCLHLLFLLTVLTPAHAEWIAVDSVAKPGEAHYFDPETLQKSDQFRKIWILSTYDAKQKGGYHAVKSLYEFDCFQNKARSITMLLYPDKKASGTVIGAHHLESREWLGFASDSTFQYISEIICMNWTVAEIVDSYF